MSIDNLQMSAAGIIAHERMYEKIPFKSGGTQTISIKTNNAISHLFLRLKLKDYDTGASVALKTGGFWNLVKKLNIIADGSDYFKSIPGIKIPLNTLIADGKLPPKSETVTPNQTALSGYNTGFVYFAIPRSLRPHDTILKGNNFNSLDLEITWGTSADLGTGFTVEDAEIEIIGSEVLDYKDVAGFYKESTEIIDIESDNDNKIVKLNVDKQYRSIKLLALADGVGNDSILKNIQVKHDSFVFKNIDATMLKLQNENFYGLQSTIAGLYVIEFCPRGYLTDRVIANGFANFHLDLNVVKQGTSCKLIVMPDFAEIGLKA